MKRNSSIYFREPHIIQSESRMWVASRGLTAPGTDAFEWALFLCLHSYLLFLAFLIKTFLYTSQDNCHTPAQSERHCGFQFMLHLFVKVQVSQLSVAHSTCGADVPETQHLSLIKTLLIFSHKTLQQSFVLSHQVSKAV